MVLLVIMGFVWVLMETVMDPVVSTGNWSLSIGGLLKPIHPNGICPKTHYRKPFLMVLMVKSWWFVMVFVVETIRIFSDGSIVLFSRDLSIVLFFKTLIIKGMNYQRAVIWVTSVFDLWCAWLRVVWDPGFDHIGFSQQISRSSFWFVSFQMAVRDGEMVQLSSMEC